MMRMLLVAVVLVVTACASTGSDTVRRDMDELTREEIQSSDYGNAYDIIRAMRPRWLRVRGPNSINAPNPISVYVDGTRYGTPEELQAIPKLSIERMKYYSPMEAQARWGLNNTNGAIEILTRKG